MTSLPKALLVVGILMCAGGVGGTGFFYRQMKVENLKHARTGDIAFPLGEERPWQKAGFNVFREGTHMLILSVARAAAESSRAAPAARVSLEIGVSAPDGTPVYQKKVTPGFSDVPPRGAAVMVLVDSFVVARTTEEPWTLQARVAGADSASAGLVAELSVLPPQLYDIGDYLAGKLVTLIGMGATALAGFALIVFSAHLQRRASAAPRP